MGGVKWDGKRPGLVVIVGLSYSFTKVALVIEVHEALSYPSSYSF